MPPKGWKAITVKESLFRELREIQKKFNLKSIPKTIVFLIEKSRLED